MKKIKIVILFLFLINAIFISINFYYFLTLKKTINYYNSYKNDDKDLTEAINKIMDEYKISKKQIIKYINFLKDIPISWPIEKEKREILRYPGLYHNKKSGHALDHSYGLIIKGKKGEPVLATADGFIDSIDKVSNGLDEGYFDIDYTYTGYTVVIQNHLCFLTRYTNLEKVIVKKHTDVKRGQIIGYLRNDEDSYLHYMITFDKRKGEVSFNYLITE